MTSNIITANFRGRRMIITEPLWQWDYGQIIRFTGLTLPITFEVHFSNNNDRGFAKTAIGTDYQVQIPDEYLTTGKNIFLWIFLHTGEYDGETEYRAQIPVYRRAMPNDDPPTPQEQSAITQAIAALNAAVVDVQEAVDAADSARTSAAAALNSASAAAASEAGVEADADRADAAASAAESAQSAAETAQTAAETAQTGAETARDDAAQAAAGQIAQINATGAAVLESIPADYTALSGNVDDLMARNSCELVKGYGSLQDVTRGGVTFTWDAAKEVCTLTGKRTAAAYNAVFSASGGMSGCFVAGETYHFAITSSSISTVYIRIYFNLSDSTSEQLDLKQASGTFTIPANTVAVSVRIQCDISTSVASISETISFRILNAPSNRDLERDLSTLTGTVTGLDSALTGLLRTETGIGNPYFAPWSVQLNENNKFSLLDMPQNTIAYTLFSYLLDTETVNFPFSDFSGIFVEKVGRGNFNLYRIYGNNNERSAIGFYSSGAFYWYACPTVKRIKIGMLGDSVTKGRIGGSSATTTKGIPYWVNYETGQPTVNLGVGSMGWISHYYAEQNAEEYIRTLDLSGYDVLTLQYGLNDGDQPLGTYEDTTEQTIMGAVYRVIDYIYTQNSTVQVIIINPTVGSKTETFPYFNPNLPHSASDRWTFAEYFTQMKLFCEKYAIPLIDGYKGLNAWNRYTLIGDNVHPTEVGYRVLGRYIAGQIKALI